MDEAAGFARAEVAAASKARKAAEAAELASENAEMRERIKNTKDVSKDVLEIATRSIEG